MSVFIIRSPMWIKDKSAYLDITVKSARNLGRYFAPTWKMVMGHKRGEITDEEYTKMYTEILDNLPDNVYDALYQFGTQENIIVFKCYCKDHKFCHTYLLIDYLLKRFPNKYITDAKTFYWK